LRSIRNTVSPKWAAGQAITGSRKRRHCLWRKYSQRRTKVPLDAARHSVILRSCSIHKSISRSREEERMASLPRNPRDILLDTDAEYKRLFEQHSKYEAELQRISKSPYLSSEDLLEEIKLKKMKLHCKDEMERIASRIQRVRAHQTQ
jgi:uncharacterized protein YdcH (DUF465 family)